MEACEIEIEILGNPIGKQDQYAAAYGGFNYIQFNKDESVFVDPIICEREARVQLNKKLLLFYTGIERVSSHILEEQKRDIDKNNKFLDEIVKLSGFIRESIVNNGPDAVGRLLHQNWVFKKQLASNITNSTIDGYYERARNAGAAGGKLLGAGGGGFLLFYCDEKHHNKVRDALSDLKGNTFLF